jgi:hypothetical protein
MIKEIKTMPPNFATFSPYNKSDKRNNRVASRKISKYIIPKNASKTETEKGKNNIEIANTKIPKILRKRIIVLYYTLCEELQIKFLEKEKAEKIA